MVICGAAWVSVLSSLQVAAQISVPSWVRGRALALYIMVFAAGMTLGSVLWGWVAAQASTPAALLISAAAVLAAVAVQKFSLGAREAPDLSPSYHWPHPPAVEELDGDRGPVLVTIEYDISLDQREAFLDAIQQLGQIRRRDGAFGWGIFEDVAAPGRYIEFFQHDSWLDHLRQHGRVTREDQRVQENVNRFHTGGEAPKVSHFVAGAPYRGHGQSPRQHPMKIAPSCTDTVPRRVSLVSAQACPFTVSVPPFFLQGENLMKIRRARDRGHAEHGWLNSWHSFSFADYHDPAHIQFRALRVINDDTVEPGQGFGTHSHRDMEIVSYVLEGALAHRDSMGNGSVIRPGSVQRMSAGTGVQHSEFNASQSERVHFLQIWFLPNRSGIQPSYEEKYFDDAAKRGRLCLVASPDGTDGSVLIHADAKMYATLLNGVEQVKRTFDHSQYAYVHIARGDASLNGTPLHAGDGAMLNRTEKAPWSWIRGRMRRCLFSSSRKN